MPGLKERAKTLVELADGAAFLFAERPLAIDEKAKALLGEPRETVLARCACGAQGGRRRMDRSLDGSRDPRCSPRRNGLKLGAVAQPLRAALTGRSTSPGVFDVLAVLGREESLARIADQID